MKQSVLVNKDGRPVGSKSWMWEYRSGFMYPEKQIILYEYQKTRNASHPPGIPERLRRHLCHGRIPGLPYHGKRERRLEDRRMLGRLQTEVPRGTGSYPERIEKTIGLSSEHEADPCHLP